MATLVMQSVGSSLGGPVGAAIGAMVGQQVDRRLFGPGPRRGPRLGDLSIQGSSYGMRVPAIYGRMRVAGTIVWATDLEESEAVSGAKGQPDSITYSYRANFAVAMSSRVKGSLGRVWADGKLLRGEAGDLKVPGTVRLLDGGEAQAVDPLIASVEGECPAYRDYLLLVFEGLELAEFGNRIPLITAEIVADEGDLRLGDVIAEASDGTIVIEDDRGLGGYAAHGETIADAVAPLLDMVDRPLRGVQGALRQAVDDKARRVSPRYLDAGPEQAGERRVEALVPEARMPRRIAIDYYEQARDYQAGRSEARAGSGRRELALDLPVVLDAAVARRWCEDWLRRQWRQRRTIEARLSLAYASLRPGDRVRLGEDNAVWELTSVELDRFAVAVEGRWTGERVAVEPSSDPGRAVTAPDVTRTQTHLHLVEPPDLDGSGRCRLLVAAANESAGWRAIPIEVTVDGLEKTIQSAGRESASGVTETSLSPGSARLLDRQSELIVTLVDPQLHLTSVSEEALLGGANAAMVGSELIQYRIALDLGGGRYRLREFYRGRRGSEAAMMGHTVGEPFVPVDLARTAVFDFAADRAGTTLVAEAAGLADLGSEPVSVTLRGHAAAPLAPVHLRAKRRDGGLELRWVRRSRSGFGWLDGVDVPVGETREVYRWSVVGDAGNISGECETVGLYVPATELAAAGAGPWTVAIRQVGDRGVSAPAVIMVEE